MRKSIFRKLVSLMLVAVMVLSMSIVAMASGQTSTHKITIKNVPGSSAVFEAYQIFSGTVEDDALSDIAWGSGVNDSALLTALKGTSYWESDSPFAECTTAQQVAYVLAELSAVDLEIFAAAVADNLKSLATGTSGAGSAQGDGTYQYEISGLADGYYVVVDKTPGTVQDYAKSKTILEICGEDTDVEFKNDIPNVNKTIAGVNGGGTVSSDGKTSTVGIGDTVSFKIESQIPTYMNDYSGGYYFEYVDTLSKGFTLQDATIKVTYKVTGTTSTSEGTIYANNGATTNTNITVTKGTYSATTGTALNIVFDTLDEIINLETLKTTIGDITEVVLTVEYDAVLNANAVVGTDGNPNKVHIKYSNDPNDAGSADKTTTSTDKTTNSFTYAIDVDKNDGDSGATGGAKALADAKFVVTRQNNSTTEIAVFDTTGKLVKWISLGDVDLSDADSIAAIDAELTASLDEGTVGIATADTGKFSISGLADDTYTFYEIEAPTGYKTVASFTVTLTAATTAEDPVEYTGELADETAVGGTGVTDTNVSIPESGVNAPSAGHVTVDVIDPPLTNLPSTGGSGVYFYYIVGGLLVLFAAGALILSRKKSDKEA